MKRKIHFTKMHGLGNDFIVIDGINQQLENINLTDFALALCNRNFGIGADGVILVLKSDKADLKMRIFNSDGSEPEMCGNGIRCFARFVCENKLLEKDVFSVETIAGTMLPALIFTNGLFSGVEVDMGTPMLEGAKIPVKDKGKDNVINAPIEIDDKKFFFTAVSMGNPHAVVFVEDLKTLNIDELGPKFENNAFFPEKINTEFTQIINKDEIIVIVWERGAGKTLACGTGACAAAVAGILNGKLNRKVKVHLPGGFLNIEWQEDDNHVIMTGPAETVFHGEIEY